MMLDRDALARKIIEVSSSCRDGYKRNVNRFNTVHENETAERCAIAASNTGYFLLLALDYSNEEIKSYTRGGKA